jgi:hypothetical protein
MRDVTAWYAVAAGALPPPPKPEQPGKEVDVLVVIAIAVVILVAVILIAWLLKPLVVRRLSAEEATRAAEEAESEAPMVGWEEVWTRRGRAAEAERAGAEEGAAVSPREEVEERPLVETLAAAGPPTPEREPGSEAIVGITLTVRELLEHANAGQPLRAFALYSEAFLARFKAESGLSDEAFLAEFGTAEPPPPEARAELAAVGEVEELPDGRVRAVIAYTNGGKPPPPERYTFVRAATGDRWLIDDIAPLT